MNASSTLPRELFAAYFVTTKARVPAVPTHAEVKMSIRDRIAKRRVDIYISLTAHTCTRVS